MHSPKSWSTRCYISAWPIFDSQRLTFCPLAETGQLVRFFTGECTCSLLRETHTDLTSD